MSRTNEFIQWIKETLIPPEFRTLDYNDLKYAEKFNLGLKRTRSLMKGNQWYLFKIIPPDFTIDKANQLNSERKLIKKTKSKFLKLLPDLFVFFYISEDKVPQQILNCLGNFYSVEKSHFGNVHEINFYFDLSTGQYIQPEKIGYVARIPIRNLIRKTQIYIFETYTQRFITNQRTQEHFANFCIECGKKNLEKTKLCGKCGASLNLINQF